VLLAEDGAPHFQSFYKPLTLIHRFFS